MKSRSRYSSALDAVRRLVSDHGCVLMKIATEDEALTHDEVRERFEIFSGTVEVELKIGGPGARGDLALCREIGIKHIIAPMVESEYALIDYLNGVEEIFGSRRKILLGVNIETWIAARSIGSILAADCGHALHQVTVGRGDLSKSMRTVPDDPKVTALSMKIVKCARALGYVTSVGGGILPGRAAAIANEIRPDYINTRNFAFRGATCRGAIRAALDAEIELCRATGTRLANLRARALSKRLGEEKRS